MIFLIKGFHDLILTTFGEFNEAVQILLGGVVSHLMRDQGGHTFELLKFLICRFWWTGSFASKFGGDLWFCI